MHQAHRVQILLGRIALHRLDDRQRQRLGRQLFLRYTSGHVGLGKCGQDRENADTAAVQLAAQRHHQGMQRGLAARICANLRDRRQRREGGQRHDRTSAIVADHRGKGAGQGEATDHLGCRFGHEPIA